MHIHTYIQTREQQYQTSMSAEHCHTYNASYVDTVA